MSIFFDIKTSIDVVHEQPGSLLWLNLFRIYKEAITNVMKHSRAKSVQVNLNITRASLVLSIYDNGRGVKQEKSIGRGISNMKTRAQEIGGKVAITSGDGTTVCLEIPLPVQYPAQEIKV